jgi:hypothetical protein
VTEPILNSDQVDHIYTACQFHNGDDENQRVQADGIQTIAMFHARRLNEHQTEISAMLDELPSEFHASGGGGWSFLNACNDKHGNQWTGFHFRMEQLFQLGIGIGRVRCLLPRDMWSVLPGGVPYYVIDAEVTS